MHYTAYEYSRAFFNNYLNESKEELIIVEIGSQSINGALKDHAPKNAKYIGLDFAEGEDVDIVLQSAYLFPLDNNYADVVVTSSCFEHSQFFWLTFIESLRILKPNGVLYVSAPSNGHYHRYPTDNWRFYPDAAKALSAYANKQSFNTAVLESFIGKYDINGWRDFNAIFIKDAQYIDLYPHRVFNTISLDLEPNNVWTHANNEIINYQFDMTESKLPTIDRDNFNKIHYSNNEYCKAFFSVYTKPGGEFNLIEIGSSKIKKYLSPNTNYINFDPSPDDYKYPISDSYADYVIINSFLEYREFFWLDFMEALRILKPNGLMYMNIPSNGGYIQSDYWRFYPDSARSLSDYANEQGFNTAILESFIGKEHSGSWKDFVGILIKDAQYAYLYSDYIYNTVPKLLEPENIWVHGNSKVINYQFEMTEKDTSLLYSATIRQDIKALQDLLAQEIDIDYIHPIIGATALYIASQEGYFEATTTLLEAGANTGVKANNGLSPLYVSSVNNEFAVTKLLLENGASTETSMPSGSTPLYAASYLGYNNIIELLLSYGANKTIQVNGVNAFQVALQNDHQSTAQLLAGGQKEFCQQIQATEFEVKYAELCGETESELLNT